MTTTLIALLSISIGIIATNLFSVFLKKYSFGFTGNTIIGVFGSIFFIKSFSRLGFDPFSIVKTGNIDFLLLFVNFLVSALGAILFLIFLKKIATRINVNNKIEQ